MDEVLELDIEDNEQSPVLSSKKERRAKRQMAKELKKALAVKKKAANFMDITVDLEGDDGERGVEFPELDQMDGENGEWSATYMTEFEPGIEYRKLSCNSIVLTMEPFRRVYFTGKCLIEVVKGSVSVYGSTLTPNGNQYAAYSAKDHSSLLFISSLSRTGPVSFPSGHLASLGLSENELNSIPGCVVILTGFENEWTDGLRATYPAFSEMVSPSISGIGPGGLPPRKNFLQKLGFNFVKSCNMDKHRGLDFPPYFDNIFDDLTSTFGCSSSGIICPFGGKGVGKSTFIKWLVNRYLSTLGKVLFIDLDPGQAEFTPPGLISANLIEEPCLGPNFTHLRTPEKSAFVGGVNVADFPVTYIKAVASLFQFCRSYRQFEGIPWIVNTMGFCQGLGVHLAVQIIKIARPQCVIQLNIDNDRRSFPFLLNRDNVDNHKSSLEGKLPRKYKEPLDSYHFLAVKSAVNRDRRGNTDVWGAPPKVLREVVLISYFSEMIGNAEGFNLRALAPLRVPLDSVAVGTMSSSLTYDGILSTLAGNLVALCEMAESSFRTVSGSNRKYLNNAGEHDNTCVGYGIVRAVDAETLYVVTPVTESEMLMKVNVILGAGGVGLPLQLYLTGGSQVTSKGGLPFVMPRGEGTSTLHAPTKKFFVPKRVTHTVLQNCLL